jgi:hypothetical protein
MSKKETFVAILFIIVLSLQGYILLRLFSPKSTVSVVAPPTRSKSLTSEQPRTPIPEPLPKIEFPELTFDDQTCRQIFPMWNLASSVASTLTKDAETTKVEAVKIHTPASPRLAISRVRTKQEIELKKRVYELEQENTELKRIAAKRSHSNRTSRRKSVSPSDQISQTSQDAETDAVIYMLLRSQGYSHEDSVEATIQSMK